MTERPDLFRGRGDHDHREGVTTPAEAIEQAYRRGVQQGAHLIAEAPPALHDELLSRIFDWRFEKPLNKEIPAPGLEGARVPVVGTIGEGGLVTMDEDISTRR